MKPTPPSWPRMSSSVHYRDPAAAIDWLCSAFGFELRLKVEDDAGQVVHSELCFGEGLVMVGGTGRSDAGKEASQSRECSPLDVGGGHTQAICTFVDDVDAHHAVARAKGARIVREPTTSDYGDDYWVDRSYGCLDPEGHLWWFIERVRTGPKP